MGLKNRLLALGLAATAFVGGVSEAKQGNSDPERAPGATQDAGFWAHYEKIRSNTEVMLKAIRLKIAYRTCLGRIL